MVDNGDRNPLLAGLIVLLILIIGIGATIFFFTRRGPEPQNYQPQNVQNIQVNVQEQIQQQQQQQQPQKVIEKTIIKEKNTVQQSPSPQQQNQSAPMNQQTQNNPNRNQ